MSILDEVRASNNRNDLIIPTLEFSCPAWADSVFLCSGYEAQTFTDEGGRVIEFQPAPIELALPKKSADVNETITISVDNVRGLAQQRVDQAKESQATISVTTRLYLESDRSAPAEKPFTMSVLSATMDETVVNLSCGYFDLVNTAWPRDRYTLDFSPGIAYL
ncbi:hypothetical protein Psm1vBMR14_gp20 [Pseudomonas phage MR14]|nr:hypothetical protein Psm1vBMR14_gp20 [Pseudomonas phage MR14]